MAQTTRSTAGSTKSSTHKTMAKAATYWTNTEGEWMDVPVFPKGAQMKVISGNPKTGASDLFVKMPAGYVAPLHWHTPAESVYMQAGTLEFGEAHSSATHTISAGGFFHSPPKMVHKATCTGNEDCYFFLHSTGPFDIHLVQGGTASAGK
jgi:quercetin dioxygenase-like cupin family protein